MGAKTLLGNYAAVWKRRRWRTAMAVALASDALSFGLEFLSLGLAEIPQLAVDLATAVAIFLLLGFRWGLLAPLVIEAFPAMSAFPSWALAVAAYAALEPAPAGTPVSPASGVS